MSGLPLSDQLSSYVFPEWKRQIHFTSLLFHLYRRYLYTHFCSSFEILEFTLFTVPSSLLSASIVPIDGNKQMTCNYILRGSIWCYIYPKWFNQMNHQLEKPRLLTNRTNYFDAMSCRVIFQNWGADIWFCQCIPLVM